MLRSGSAKSSDAEGSAAAAKGLPGCAFAAGSHTSGILGSVGGVSIGDPDRDSGPEFGAGSDWFAFRGSVPGSAFSPPSSDTSIMSLSVAGA